MKTTPSSTKVSALPPATHEQITQRAHRIWIEEGRPEGKAREHWLEAERQLRDPSAKRTERGSLSTGEIARFAGARNGGAA